MLKTIKRQWLAGKYPRWFKYRHEPDSSILVVDKNHVRFFHSNKQNVSNVTQSFTEQELDERVKAGIMYEDLLHQRPTW